MKKGTLRRFALLLSALIAVAALAACGQAPAAATTQATAATAAAEAAANAAEATTAAEEAATTAALDDTAATTAASAAAAGENFNPTGLPVVNSPISLHIVVRGDTNYTKPYEELELNKQWVSDTNINVEWELFDGASWNDKVNLMLVSGELPDVLMGPISPINELTYAQQGYWQPLQDLIEQDTVYLKEFSQMYPDIYASYYAPDGNIYSLPRMKGQEDMEYLNRSYINQKWLDTLGLEMPNNVDELYNAFKAFKEQDPNGNGEADEIPLAFIYTGITSTDRTVAGDKRNALWGLFGMFGRVDTVDHIVIENGEPLFTADKDEYKNALIWLNKLYAEGMIDPEAFTMDATVFQAKNTSGVSRYGVWTGWTVTEATNPPEEGIKEYTMMPPLEDANGVRRWPKFAYNVIQKGMFFITRDNEYPRETIRWVDYLSSPEFSIQTDWGIEGIGSKINDDGTWEILGGGLTSNRTAEGMAWLVPTMVPKYVYDDCIYTSQVKAFEAEACNVFSPYGVEIMPNVYFTLEDTQDMIQLSTDIGSYISRMTAQFITEGNIEAGWDEYNQTLNSMGLERYVEIYKNTYARYLESR